MLKLIYAHDINNNINIDFTLKPDLQRFKELTQNHIVVMGRKTFESLPKKENLHGLPYRTNVVLSNNSVTEHLNYDITYLTKFINKEVEQNINFIGNIVEESKTRDIWIIGGKQIYELFLPYIDFIYETFIYKQYTNREQLILNIDYENYKLLDETKLQVYNGITYNYLIWEKK